MAEDTAEGLKDAIRVDSEQLRGHVDEGVRLNVEETLNGLLQAEADSCAAPGAMNARPKRNVRNTRAGHYERKLEPKAGVIRLKIQVTHDVQAVSLKIVRNCAHEDANGISCKAD